jgi:hypothetical protein
MYEQLFRRIQPLNRKEQMYGRNPTYISSWLLVAIGSVMMCIVMVVVNIGKKLFCFRTSKRKAFSNDKLDKVRG